MNNEHPSGAPYHDCREVLIQCDPSEIFPGFGFACISCSPDRESQITNCGWVQCCCNHWRVVEGGDILMVGKLMREEGGGEEWEFF